MESTIYRVGEKQGGTGLGIKSEILFGAYSGTGTGVDLCSAEDQGQKF